MVSLRIYSPKDCLVLDFWSDIQAGNGGYSVTNFRRNVGKLGLENPAGDFGKSFFRKLAIIAKD